MIQVVCWKWGDEIHPKKNIKFTSDHVNILKNMVKRHLHTDHEFVCITDNPDGIDSDIRIVPLWDDYKELGGCYVRLKVFSEEMQDVIGDKFISLDLDTVINEDITPLVTCKEDFKIWGDTHPLTPYNGSMFLMKAGSRKQVWTQFTSACIKHGRARRYIGTDQAWIAVCLGSEEKKWTTDDGVYSHRVHFMKRRKIDPYPNQKITFFHGSSDPSQREVQMRYSWVRQNWH